MYLFSHVRMHMYIYKSKHVYVGINIYALDLDNLDNRMLQREKCNTSENKYRQPETLGSSL